MNLEPILEKQEEYCDSKQLKNYEIPYSMKSKNHQLEEKSELLEEKENILESNNKLEI